MTDFTSEDASQAPPLTLETMADLRRWVAWQLERSGERVTKVPYAPLGGGKAKANDPSSWGTMYQAYDRFERLPKPYNGEGGIGVELGDLHNGTSLGGVDLDSCRDRDGNTAEWAQEVISRLRTYTEVSPSLTGVKLLLLYDSKEMPLLRKIMGAEWGKMFKRGGGEHPPAIEVHFGNRYFATTALGINGTPAEIRHVSFDDLLWLLEQAGPAFAQNSQREVVEPSSSDTVTDIGSLISQLGGVHSALKRYWSGDFSDLTDQSRSAMAMALGAALKRAGFDYETMCRALRLHHATSDWTREKGDAHRERELKRIWDKVDVQAEGSSATREPSIAVLRRTIIPAPALPLAAFGPFWGDWISCAAAGANAPSDYTALALLALASALIGNSRWATAWDGWSEPPVLWSAGVGDPSSGKSPGAAPVMRDALAIVEAWMQRDYPVVRDEWVARSVAATARRKDWEKSVAQAVESGEQPPPMPSDVDAGDEPKPPRVRVGNITIEEFIRVLVRLPKGALCSNDELASWLGNMQRYNRGCDRPFWLEAYVGGPFPYDRVNVGRPISIPRLAVAMFGTIQPDRLANALTEGDDGLVGRFLWSWPDPVPFRRPSAIAHIRAASDALCRLADLSMTTDDDGILQPIFIRLTDDAADVLESFVLRVREREARAHGLMKSTLGKARGQALRLALVLTYLWWSGAQGAEPQAIHRRVVEAAVGLMDEYFLPMAERVFGDAVVSTQECNARTLGKWIVDTKPTGVNVTQVRDKARLPGLRESDDVKNAIRFLVEANILLDERPMGGAGRPRGDYRVNPRLWEVLEQVKD